VERIEREHTCIHYDRLVEVEARQAETEQKLALVMARLEQFEKKVLGPQSERMPSVAEELRKEQRRRGQTPDSLQTRNKRKANQEALKAAAVEHHVDELVTDEQRTCPECGEEAKTISKERTSETWSYVPGYFRRNIFHCETVACDCGDYIATAAPPPRIFGQSKYDASFIAYLVVSKVCDSIPFYRQEKRFKRKGMPIARTTMNTLLKRAGEELRILHRRMLELIGEQGVVLADETSLPVVDVKKCRRGFIWTFSSRVGLGEETEVLVGFRYSKDRSGLTPVEVLGDSKGVLVVDGYSGYNRVTCPDGRERAACLAHVRRKFFDARSTAEADVDAVLGLVLDVYRVEHEALEREIVRTKKHLALRQTEGRLAMDALRAWLDAKAPAYPPRSAMGRAINYALNNWERLCVFLDDENVPVDNNESERFLRPVAKGRDNWLFAGNDEAAENIAVLLTLTSACEANRLNPEEYLADVIPRLSTHPAADLDELLPHRWQPRAAA